MKSLKVAKYNLSTIKKSIIVYYCIFILVCISVVMLNHFQGGMVSSSGLEFSTIIFLFVVGLNIFKESFYFTQSNNISRKTYFKGMILSIFPITAIAAVIDVIINRVYNLFMNCPSNYDMMYTSFRDMDIVGSITGSGWVQSNDIMTLLNTFLLQFAVCTLAFAIGLAISIIYYRCNKLMKVVVSVAPIVFIMLLNIFMYNFTETFSKIAIFIENILGWNTQNPYAAMTTVTVLFIAVIAFIYLLVRKAVIKER